ncbi:hypothetical protein JL722_6498 [Aureococcus anophagefferens]|nr:hypothetical protein JL722_6498 [Aureococcus anophagefferens]
MSARLELPLRSIRLVIAYAASWDPSDDAERWFKFVSLLSVSRSFHAARPLLFELLVNAQAPCKARVAELEDRFMFIRPSFRGMARGTLKNAVKQLRTVETRELTKVFRALRRGGVGAREAMVRAVAEATPGEFYERLCAWYDRERFAPRRPLCALSDAAVAPPRDAPAAAAAKFSAALLEQTRGEMRAASLAKPPPSHPSPRLLPAPPTPRRRTRRRLRPSEARLQRGVFRV